MEGGKKKEGSEKEGRKKERKAKRKKSKKKERQKGGKKKRKAAKKEVIKKGRQTWRNKAVARTQRYKTVGRTGKATTPFHVKSRPVEIQIRENRMRGEKFPKSKARVDPC